MDHSNPRFSLLSDSGSFTDCMCVWMCVLTYTSRTENNDWIQDDRWPVYHVFFKAVGSGPAGPAIARPNFRSKMKNLF